ncbi:MAG: SDR family NAD(P)-dependent oxidoreductase, partial [Pseudomonadota bacterium]|nr:SDR family NAD(P)-dependent oxidoreductase [Pseudomonadota bacterium]
MEDLKDKVVAITGGATGIGFALAKSLGVEGAKIIIGEPRQEALDSAIAGLSELDIEAISAPLDVANLSSVEAFADVAWEHYGRVDMLINNAGIMHPPKTLSAQGYEIQFAVNHLAHMLLTLKLLPVIEKKEESRI